MWKWLERKIFRRLEMRLSAELDARTEHLQRELARTRERVDTVLAHELDVIDDLERIAACLARAECDRAEILAFAKVAADVRQAAEAADHAGKLEQLSRHVTQAIALQGKTPDSFPRASARSPRTFDLDTRQTAR